MGDNRIFNINGVGPEFLEQVLALAFMQENTKTSTGWTFMPDKGYVIYSYGKPEHLYRAPQKVQKLAEKVCTWLKSKEALSMTCDGWDADYNDSDVSTERGWRVYVEDWGHVGNQWGVICAVRPAYMWYGK